MLELSKKDAIQYFKDQFFNLKMKLMMGERLERIDLDILSKLIDERIDQVTVDISKHPDDTIIKIDKDVA